MTKKTLSLLLLVVLSLSMFPLSASANNTITSAEYDGGVVNVRGTGFTAATTYLVSVIDTASGSVTALEQAIATSEGAIHAAVTTGALTDASKYIAKIHNLSGALVASRAVYQKTVTPGTTDPTGSPGSSPGATISATGTITIQAVTDNAGIATAKVTDAELKQAVARAEEAAASGNKAAAVIIELKTGAKTANNTVLQLSPSSILTLIDSKVDTVIIQVGSVQLNLDKKVLEAIKSSLAGGNSAGDVRISISALNTQDELARYSQEAGQNLKNKLGDRPMYSLTITAGNQTISDFQGGVVTVTLPYSQQKGEHPQAIVIYYVDSSGHLLVNSSSYYHPASKTVSFRTNHFSVFAVGYNEKSFADVSAHAWYNEAVTFAAARGITNGISESQFGPELMVTRGDFLVLLMRAYGLDADPAVKDNFVDAGNTYYTPYLATAKKLGLVNGVGDNRFKPEASISRQDMIVMIYNVLERIGELPVAPDNGKAVTDFKDGEEIAAYADKAMKLMVESGVLSGSNGQLLPKDSSTRAQTMQVLFSLMKRTV
jgi:hypothetical protein